MRTKMKLVLTKQSITFPREVALKNIEQSDVLRLGTLFYEAYFGTIDYDGETREQAVQETQDTINGKYGAFINDCSFIAEMNGEPVSFLMVTMWQDRPFLAYSATHQHGWINPYDLPLIRNVQSLSTRKWLDMESNMVAGYLNYAPDKVISSNFESKILQKQKPW